MKTVKVVYILAFARSGTTLLGDLLGEIEGFFHVGELHHFWPRVLRSHRNKCGCERPLPDCPFWSRVRATMAERIDAGGDSAEDHVRERSERSILESRDHATGLAGWQNLFSDAAESSSWFEEHVRATELLYRTIAEVSGSRVVVDSSKLPRPASYLAHMESIEPYYVHVVRDPRGCVFSRQRRKAPREDGKVVLAPITAAMDTVRWMRRNLSATLLGRNHGEGRYFRVRYEDFAVRPVTTLKAILDAVEEPSRGLPFLDERTAVIGPNHTVLGNQNRFDTGEVVVRLDDRWLSGLRKRDHRLVTSLAAPLLLGYGYSLSREMPSRSGVEAVPGGPGR